MVQAHANPVGPAWSPMQSAVFVDVASGTGHTVVLARAGSGKTTTITEALNHVPRGCSALLVAFNKSIAEELKRRVTACVEISTLHSFGFRALRNTLGSLKVDGRKVDYMLRPRVREREDRAPIVKAVSLAKGALASSADELDALLDEHGIELPEEMTRTSFLRHVMWCLEECKSPRGSVDFDDMIWLPIVTGIKLPMFDRVFVDETQDLNPCQLEMVLRACRKSGRICAVGDDRQAIYRFRGADADAVNLIVERLGAKILPLSVSYRCARNIIALAQNLVPDIEAAPHAVDGIVRGSDIHTMTRQAEPGDFVLSRTNAPLVTLCLRWLAEGKRATIAGRDIGAGLAAFVKRSDAADVMQLRAWVLQWRDAEVARLEKADRDSTAAEDKAACLLALSEGAPTIQSVLDRIESLFADDDDEARVVLSTTHKAKGLERERVWLLRDTYMRKRKGQAQLSTEEENLFYVAVTRAKRELVLVEGVP